MNFFAILLALLLEQARPLGQGNPVHRTMVGWARGSRHSLDAGQPVHGWLAWGMAVLLPAALAAVVYGLLWHFSVLLAFAWTVLVLYWTVGFRQFSHHFTAIRDALESGDEEAARAELAAWQEVDVSRLPKREIVRHVIEYSAVAAHRHVFGVLACYIVLALLGLGPAGAVLYRMAEFLSRSWQVGAGDAPSDAVVSAARRAWAVIDFIPARVTGLAFAVVGNFEEAVAAWRQDAKQFPNTNDGVVLASTSGAINVRLGGSTLASADAPMEQPAGSSASLTDGREPQLAHLTSLVGLVWRSVVLWMLLMALMTLARSVG